MQIIDADEITRRLTWPALVEALREGHRRPKPLADDMLLEPGDNRVLVRAAWIEGLGGGLKAVTIFPGNPAATPPRPAVQGQFLLFDEARGDVVAVIEGAALTAWKTAADSALGADLLARTDAATLLMIGAGAMAGPLINAHLAVRPSIRRVLVWNRTGARAEALAGSLAGPGRDVEIVADLETAVGQADVISSATMATEPVIRGDWLSAGTHLDLVGAYTPTMREADDATLRRTRLFADYLPTAHETGELADPIARGVISRDDVAGDLYDLVAGRIGRGAADDITLYKNGGGAHLDLMTARAIVSAGASGRD
jgi:ornithine cyclodeaminase